jgi:hypothetical protein
VTLELRRRHKALATAGLLALKWRDVGVDVFVRLQLVMFAEPFTAKATAVCSVLLMDALVSL